MTEHRQGPDIALGQVRGLCPLIQVYDMPESIRFYCDRLGFALVSDSGLRDTPEGRMFHWAWLRLDGADLMLNTAYDEGERPPERDASRQGAHGDTCLYFAAPDVDGVATALRSKGIAFEGPRDATYGMRQLWFSDPDGYQLCFQAPV